MHYRFHQKIDPSQYPQVHDFYEIMLVTDGKMEMEINRETELAGTGALFLIRPGDVHNRKAVGACSYINLAFPAEVVEKMFRYLDIPEMKQRILGLPRPPRTKLTAGETLLLKARLEKLNLLPLKQPHVICMELRRLMLDVMLQYFLPAFSSPVHMSCPGWLEKLAEKLEHPDYFSCSLEELASMSGCSREHLCRSFKNFKASAVFTMHLKRNSVYPLCSTGNSDPLFLGDFLYKNKKYGECGYLSVSPYFS